MAIKRKSMAGISLIEVLISVLVLGVGMLGIAAMQATALRNSQSSLERSQAVIQVYTIFDAMRANSEVATSGATTRHPVRRQLAVGVALSPTILMAGCKG